MLDYVNRQRTLLEIIEGDAYLAVNHEGSDPATIRYLTGFTGEGALLLSKQGAVLLTDSRYTEQAKGETEDLSLEEDRGWRLRATAEAISKRGLERIVFPSARASFHWVEEMRKLGAFTLVPEQDPAATLRRTKSPDEIDCLKKAAAIADEAFASLVPELRVGMNEAEAALRLEVLIRETDAEGIAFGVNCSTGANTALNHYNPSLHPRPLATGDLLLFDFGACYGGYRSDITRTVSVGKPQERAREIYDIVLRANLAAIEAVQAGKTGSDIDAVARDLIAEAGYADSFGHGLGHGIGLEVHEAPGLSPRNNDPLEAGMVATIEPGIYLPGFGGVRIEDDVVVGPDGCEVITGFPKHELIEVGR
jgi:Xaa-Pro aminopeptidase